jgi:hypothetical protein
MRKLIRVPLALLIGILSVLAGGRPSWAAVCPGSDGTIECGPLQYHGGPFLETFEIYPLYYGTWKESDIDTQQAYVVNLAAYMSGKNAPAFEQPMMKQYGVDHVTVAAAKTASAIAGLGPVLSRDNILTIIEANQDSGKLPKWGPHRLIVVFPGEGLSLDTCKKGGCGYHSSQSTEAFWAVIPQNAAQVVIAHEVFEASADPADDTFNGWDEAVDQCDNAPNITLPAFGKAFQIPPATDNTNGGACSTTGYTSLDEIQVYGWKYYDYLNKYNELFPLGWRLYILQAYVLGDGEVRWNAVWRPAGNTDEKPLFGATLAQVVSEFNTLYGQGWRPYILQSYVLANGEVLYNAVWRRGDYYIGDGTGKVGGVIEVQPAFGVTWSQFVSDFNALYQAASNEKGPGWRLYILQTYVTASGELLYNAFWRPGDVNEADNQQATYAQFESEYDALYPQGWRLYIFQSYVVPGGQVLHNMVWRPGTHDETAVYGRTYSEYLKKYNELWPNGWRLYVLNTYVLPSGEVRYDAVWRLGTIDRPL